MKYRYAVVFLIFLINSGVGFCADVVLRHKISLPPIDGKSGKFQLESGYLNRLVAEVVNNPEYSDKDIKLELVFPRGVYQLLGTQELLWGRQNRNDQLTLTGEGARGDVQLNGFVTLPWPSIPDQNSQGICYSVLPEKYSFPKVARVTEGFGRNSTPRMVVLDEKKWMALSKFPSSGFFTIENPGKTSFSLSQHPNPDLFDQKDIQAEGYFFWGWAKESIPVESVDKATGSITLKSAPQFGIGAGKSVGFRNLKGAINDYESWAYIDNRLFAKCGNDQHSIRLSALDNLIVIKNSKNIVFSNIVLEGASGSGLLVTDSQHITFNDGAISNVGNQCAVFYTVKFSGISNSEIYNCGEGGVTVYSGTPVDLAPGNSYVKNSKIWDFGRNQSSYRPAVRLVGVSNFITGNELYNSGHSAIIFTGNNHVIKNNTIHHVVLEASDAGAIYTGRNWAGRGTVISDNVFHDIGGTSNKQVRGVYLDDQASGITVEANVFNETAEGVLVGGGNDNRIFGNFFINNITAITVDNRGENWQKADSINVNGALQKSVLGVDYKSDIYKAMFPSLADLLTNNPGKPRGNVVYNNSFIGPGSNPVNNLAGDGCVVKYNRVYPNVSGFGDQFINLKKLVGGK